MTLMFFELKILKYSNQVQGDWKRKGYHGNKHFIAIHVFNAEIIFFLLTDLARPLVNQGLRRLNHFAFFLLSGKHQSQIATHFSNKDFISTRWIV